MAVARFGLFIFAIAGGTALAVTLFLRYVVPLFLKGQEEENKAYDAWMKFLFGSKKKKR